MKKQLLIYILLFSSLGFHAQKDIQDNLIPKEKIGVHNRNFKLGGFYYSKRMQVRFDNDTARYIAPSIFFKNGTVLNFDYIGNNSGEITVEDESIDCTLKLRQDFETIIEFFKCYSVNVKSRTVSSVYSIDGNIIRIQHLYKNHRFDQEGVVLNDSTFVLTKQINYSTKEEINKSYIYQFQSSKKPDSTKMRLTSKIKKHFFR